mmetsp:Transcript_27825/g.64237  ORF Transcript_27825/g.64237 Transcript_27825/m.64237 type:complete len:106 (+) Transcript_27825:49-366(+)
MVQKSLSLNSNKAAKGGRRHDKPQVSKVDLLKKKKKDDVRKLVPGAKTAERKKTVRCEQNLAARAQVEGHNDIDIVKVAPQLMAKAKDRAKGGIGGFVQKEGKNL